MITDPVMQFNMLIAEDASLDCSKKGWVFCLGCPRCKKTSMAQPDGPVYGLVELISIYFLPLVPPTPIRGLESTQAIASHCPAGL